MKRSNTIRAAVGASVILAAVQAGAQIEVEEAPPVDIKPRPAEIMPLAPKSLLLDVMHTGEQYVAVGDRGHILLSPNASEWTQSRVPVRAPLTAVYFADPQTGWAVGHDSTIVHTSDGGKTWTLQNFEPELEMPFLDVYFFDTSRGLATGAYGLFYETSDGGQTWAEKDAPAVREEEVHLNSIVRLNNGDLLISGEMTMLALSRDEGETWTRLESPYEGSLFGALPMGDRGAVIFGLRGNVFMTDDVRGGQWQKLDTQSVASMFGGTRLPDGRFVMVGLNGVILISDESGKVTSVQSSTGTSLAAALPLDGTLLAVGDSGVQSIKVP